MTLSAEPRVGVVIVAAGSGRRFGDDSKVLAMLCGRPVLTYSLDVFRAVRGVTEIVVVAGEHTLAGVSHLLSPCASRSEDVCLGGETRNTSVRNGFDRLSDGIDIVVVHDAARPLVTLELAARVIAAANEHGAATPVVPVSDTVCRVGDDGSLVESLRRDALRAVQTPQAARRELLGRALKRDGAYTDEGSALLAEGIDVATIEGDNANMKLTWPHDLAVAEVVLRGRRA